MTWRPESEADIRALIESGDANESHVLDFKREAGKSDGERKETARDMASFAIDGGAIVIGVDEPTKDAFALAPFDTTGEVERIEQIAAARVRVPLFVSPRVIPSDEQPGLGYVIVDVPPSPQAPHQVDGRFYGRGEKTKRVLDVAEVERMIVGRRNIEDRIEVALQEERYREPDRGAEPHSRAFLVAVPLAAPPGAGRAFVKRGDGPMFGLARSAEGSIPKSVTDWAPSPGAITTTARRSSGIAATNLGKGRELDPERGRFAGRVLDIEAQVSGSIRIMFGDTVRVGQGDPAPRFICDGLVVAWAHRLVYFAKVLADEMDYRGPWGFGVHVYGLKGLQSLAVARDWRIDDLPTYDADDYSAMTTASLGEMMEQRNAVVDRIVGDLVLALGTSRLYEDALLVRMAEDSE